MAIDRDLALRYLGDCLYGAILGQAGAIRPSDLVRSLPRGMRLSVALMRQLLTEDERFEELAGRFDIANRQTVNTRPFGGAIDALLHASERPMPISLMTTALARIRGGSPEYFAELLDEYVATRDEIVYAAEHVVHGDWLLQISGEDEREVLFYNLLDRDEDLLEMWKMCQERDLRRRDPGLTASNILSEFERPIGPRQLAFLTWTHHPQIFDPVDFVAQGLERGDIIPACGMWFGAEQIDALHDILREASEQLSGEGEEILHVDLVELLAQEPPATPFKLEAADLENILAVIRNAQAPIGIDELIVDLLGIGPDERRFIAAAHALERALVDQKNLIEVSPGRHLSREAIPDWVREVPAPLIPVETEAEEDVLIELEALPDQLRAEVLDPLYEDICSGVESEFDEGLASEESIDYPLLHHHYVMGTVALRAIDRPFFASRPPLSLLVMRYDDVEAYPIWLNAELGLLFGLTRWYQRHLPPSGAVFRITHGDDSESCVVEYDGDTEDELFIDEDRMALLERKRERVSHRPISIRDLMVELLEEHDDGLSFNALWAEMNAVRRTSRWRIASLLAYHACFSEDEGRWTADRALINEPGDESFAEAIISEDEDEADGDDADGDEEK
ncbi:MAG: hypothetical protein ACOX9R_03615 [Armatimonadota bacterium]|jgi:hypothetical protein